MWKTLSVPHDSSPTILIAETVDEIHVGKWFLLLWECGAFWSPHRTKHIKVTEAQPLAKAVCQQELDEVTAVLARSTSAKINNGVETNFSLLYFFFCFKCPIEHALEFQPLRRETLCIICNGIWNTKNILNFVLLQICFWHQRKNDTSTIRNFCHWHVTGSYHTFTSDHRMTVIVSLHWNNAAEKVNKIGFLLSEDIKTCDIWRRITLT
jgi:hypothetical protein